MNVLILCMYMTNGFHGTVLHALEYAEYFAKTKNKVKIGAVYISDQMLEEAAKAGAELYSIWDLPLEEEYDIVFGMHLFLFPAMLLRRLKYRRSIAISLSISSQLEKLPPTSFWPKYDLITCLSDEIANMYQQLYGINQKNFTRVPNHIPLSFLQAANRKNNWNGEIKKVCVVSNNFVPELLEIGEAAPWPVDYYGKAYGNNNRITPDILLNYDVIITNGKTVQYGLGLGTPVFEYNSAGGCGYITLENIAQEVKTNFSGRGTARRHTAAELVENINGGYGAAAAQMPELRKEALARFSIRNIIEKQLELVNGRPLARDNPITADALLFANSCVVALDLIHEDIKIMRGNGIAFT